MLTATELAAIHQVHPQTIKHWRCAGIVSGQRYNDKGEYLYHPPDPNIPLARPKTGRHPNNPDQHKAEHITQRPEGAQHATRAFACGQRGGILGSVTRTVFSALVVS
jgi:hypothetical protein